MTTKTILTVILMLAVLYGLAFIASNRDYYEAFLLLAVSSLVIGGMVGICKLLDWMF